MVEPEAARGDRHHTLESKYSCGPPNPRLSPEGRVRQHDAIASRDVPNPVRPGERAVHPVERRGLGRPDVRAHVLDRVVAERP